jgi:alkyl hydroperoxide reductase subunit AhpC
VKFWLVQLIHIFVILHGYSEYPLFFGLIFSCFKYRITKDCHQGGVGKINFPLISDKTMQISKTYGVLKEDEGIAYRGLFIIDIHGILRQITINDLPVGRSVDETLRLVQAFQYTDKHGDGRLLFE